MAQYIQGKFYKIEYDDEFENNIINEEYRIWKKNVPFLYDTVITHETEWPTLTVQWMPEKSSNNEYSLHKLLLGTHTDNNETNYLMIAKVRIPNENQDEPRAHKQSGEAQRQPENKVNIEIKIVHEGEINRFIFKFRAKYMPQNSKIIATKTNFGDILVFDYNKHPTTPDSDLCKPNLRLKGLSDEGYGLSWNPLKEGYLVSGNFDQQIGIWDINQKTEKNNVIQPLNTFKHHHGAVQVSFEFQDVSWHHFDADLFASCSDDHSVSFTDTRTNTVANNFIAHASEIYSCDFNPLNEFLFATGSLDQTIGIWDLRNTSQKLKNLKGHKEEVVKVEWSQFNMGILASCSNDRRVIVWDLTRENDEIENGLFIHAGHKSKVNEFSWNKNDKLLIASVEQENILQIWQMVQFQLSNMIFIMTKIFKWKKNVDDNYINFFQFIIIIRTLEKNIIFFYYYMVKNISVGRRGYKKCRNSQCSQYLHINQHICQYCQYNNAQACRNKDKPLMNKKIQSITKRNKVLNQSQIYTWKKYFLSKDEFNRKTISQLTPSIQKNYSEMKNPQINILNYHNQYIDFQYITGKNTQKNKLKQFQDTFLSSKQQQEPKIKQEETQNPHSDSWTEYLYYFGFPINSISWLPDRKEQYLAVSIQLEDLSDNYDEDMSYLTVQTYQMKHLTKLGLKYEKNSGYFAIFELKKENQFRPKMSKFFNKFKWFSLPKAPYKAYNGRTNQNKAKVFLYLVGKLLCLKSTGKIIIYNIQNYQNFQEYQIKSFIEIQISEDVILSCFDQLKNLEANMIIAGDQIGNIYWIKITQDSFEIEKVFPHAHSMNITDLKFYQHENSTLFASCSYDGTFKIFDFYDNQPIFDQQFSTKKLNSIMWDYGGKFVLVNKEGCSPATIIVSLFAAFKNTNKSIQISNKHETRQLDKNQFEHNIFQDSILNMSGSYYSQYVFISDSQGNVFYYGKENLRKLAVKRIKNNKGKIKYFSKNHYDKKQKIFNIYHKDLRTENYEKFQSLQINNCFNENQQIRAIELCPNPINQISEGQIDSILAQGDYFGFLRISKIENNL